MLELYIVSWQSFCDSKIKNLLNGPGWVAYHLIQQKVVGSIPGQCTYLACRFDPSLGCLGGN